MGVPQKSYLALAGELESGIVMQEMLPHLVYLAGLILLLGRYFYFVLCYEYKKAAIP